MYMNHEWSEAKWNGSILRMWDMSIRNQTSFWDWPLWFVTFFRLFMEMHMTARDVYVTPGMNSNRMHHWTRKSTLFALRIIPRQSRTSAYSVGVAEQILCNISVCSIVTFPFTWLVTFMSRHLSLTVGNGRAFTIFGPAVFVERASECAQG